MKLFLVYGEDYNLEFMEVCENVTELKDIALEEYGINLDDDNYSWEQIDRVGEYKIKLVKDGE